MPDSDSCAEPRYIKSSHSGSGNCVEVMECVTLGDVYLRNSRDHDAAPLVFPAHAWHAFLADVKLGRYDLF